MFGNTARAELIDWVREETLSGRSQWKKWSWKDFEQYELRLSETIVLFLTYIPSSSLLGDNLRLEIFRFSNEIETYKLVYHDAIKEIKIKLADLLDNVRTSAVPLPRAISAEKTPKEVSPSDALNLLRTTEAYHTGESREPRVTPVPSIFQSALNNDRHDGHQLRLQDGKPQTRGRCVMPRMLKRFMELLQKIKGRH